VGFEPTAGGDFSRKPPIFLFPRTLKILLLTLFLLGLLYLGFMFKFLQAIAALLASNLMLVSILFLFLVIIYLANKVGGEEVSEV
jgi:hypothetical protein